MRFFPATPARFAHPRFPGFPVNFFQRDRDLDAQPRQIVAIAPLAIGFVQPRRQPAKFAGDFQHPGNVREVGINLVFFHVGSQPAFRGGNRGFVH